VALTFKVSLTVMALIGYKRSIPVLHGAKRADPGIAQVTAIQLLSELSTLPPDLSVRKRVAHSGLDLAHEISGSSVRNASRRGQLQRLRV
jgi:hypothetical protein